MEAGKRYEIRMEYYERGGKAVAKLLWNGSTIATAHWGSWQLESQTSPNNYKWTAPVLEIQPIIYGNTVVFNFSNLEPGCYVSEFSSVNYQIAALWTLFPYVTFADPGFSLSAQTITFNATLTDNSGSVQISGVYTDTPIGKFVMPGSYAWNFVTNWGGLVEQSFTITASNPLPTDQFINSDGSLNKTGEILAGQVPVPLANLLTAKDDYVAINLGQLKAVAAPFYNRLIEIGYTGFYPWSSSPETKPADDFALANIGQVKNIFSFDVVDFATVDSDNNGLADAWERTYFRQIGVDPGFDADNDGLVNLQEYRLGTHPLKTDTDGDTLLDGEEVALGINPLAEDTDLDTISDGFEVDFGSDPKIANPANEDSDNDGLTNSEEAYQQTNPVKPDTDGDGLSDGFEVKNLLTNPLRSDTDSDGLPDGWEWQRRLDPLVYNNPLIDSDSDGLSLEQEYLHDTDPNSTDSDGDGKNDGAEVAAGSSPGDPSDKGQPPAEADKVPVTFAIANTGKTKVGKCADCHTSELSISGGVGRVAATQQQSSASQVFNLISGKSYEVTLNDSTYRDRSGSGETQETNAKYTASISGIGILVDDPQTMLGNHPIEGAPGKKATVYVPKVELTAYASGTKSSPGNIITRPTDKTTPYIGILAINADNDDQRPTPAKDNDDTTLGSADDDVVKVTLSLKPFNMSKGTLTLTVPSGVRAFDSQGSMLTTADYTIDLALPTGKLAGLKAASVDIYLEGLDAFAAGDVELALDSVKGTLKLIPVQRAPDYLEANTNFDERKLKDGFVVSDAADPALDAISGPFAGKNCIDDLHEGFFGLPPGVLPYAKTSGATVKIRKLAKTDLVLDAPQSGEVRLHRVWGDSPSQAEHIELYDSVSLVGHDIGYLYNEPPSASNARYYLEGVKPGRITLEFTFRRSDLNVTFEQEFIVATRKSRAAWLDEITEQIKLETEASGSVDMHAYRLINPTAGVTFLDVKPQVQQVYRFYEGLHHRTPEVQRWGGLAKRAGCAVYGGFSDMQRWLDQPFSIGDGADTGVIWFLQSVLVEGGYSIYHDLAWQSRAYERGGYYALEFTRLKNLDGGVGYIKDIELEPWLKIARGDLGGDTSKILDGVFELTNREQRFIVQPAWNRIDAATTFGVLEWALAALSKNPLPAEADFDTVYPDNNIVKFDERWPWVINHMLPQWGSMSEADRNALVGIPLVTAAQHYSYAFRIFGISVLP
jgi:hypothetical protein